LIRVADGYTRGIIGSLYDPCLSTPHRAVGGGGGGVVIADGIVTRPADVVVLAVAFAA